MKAHYTIAHIEPPASDRRGYIGLIDENTSTSVTNDAENVVRELAASYDLDLYIVLYRDSLGRWDRLLTKSGRFDGFSLIGARSFAKAIESLRQEQEEEEQNRLLTATTADELRDLIQRAEEEEQSDA